MSARPRLGLIHATPVAIDPIRSALSAGWPEAETFNLLDESLAADLEAAGKLTPRLSERIYDLARYARKSGADGILFTCSAFGTAIEAAAERLDVPVLKPNEAMFEAAIQAGSNVAMIATFAPAREGMEAEFDAEVRRLGVHCRLTTIVEERAMAALKGGDEAMHNLLVADRAAALLGYDAIMLAHFSTARAASEARARTCTPVLTSPDAAIAKLRRLVAGCAV